jgi:hypothetical protein
MNQYSDLSQTDIADLWDKAQVTPTDKLSPHEAAVRIVLSARAMENIAPALDVAVNLIQLQRAAERERAARIAEEFDPDKAFYDMEWYQSTIANNTCKAVAEAIREGG